MCGIAGIWTIRAGVDDARQQVETMTQALRHRGPDDEGVELVSGGGVPGATGRTGLEDASAGPIMVLGHRRLSILDLSMAGHQPMRDRNAGNWITYNGEVYNFRDLRAQLESLGHIFHSSCDTEVILKGYAEWGVGCWRRLRGIFAFGLWDAKCRELHLVRDHLGVKPLYFARTAQGLAFASEVRAILAGGWVPGRMSPEGLNSFLKYGSVQEPCTLVQGVESVPAGHYLTCSAEGKTMVRHFWVVSECVVRNWEKPPETNQVRQHLEDSVQRQLISDVPVGVFLSGGVDSTVIAALAARAQPGAIRTFCIGMEQPEFDESTEAAETAKILGCQHTMLMLEGKSIRELLPQALGSYDQPSYDGINTYFISRLVRQAGIKVALSGLGGDELFVGYNGFQKIQRMNRIGRVARLVPRPIRNALGEGFASFSSPGSSVFGSLSEAFNPELAESYFSSRTLFCRWHIRKLMGLLPALDWSAQAWIRREHELSHAASTLGGVDRASFLELQTYMLSTLLRDSDQMSMAHGLELRVPLIDPMLVEHILPIPSQDKIMGRAGKQLLFNALHDLIPPGVIKRRKRGFTLPFREWMQRDLQNTMAHRFLAIKPRGPWDEKVFRQVWTNFQAGRVAWSRVFSLFVLENWLQENGVGV